ncbi:hypothetical protein A2U01_0030933, partial [Trifolium medium]|nr:hypothetical protein [Trifolium medium]
ESRSKTLKTFISTVFSRPPQPIIFHSTRRSLFLFLTTGADLRPPCHPPATAVIQSPWYLL